MMESIYRVVVKWGYREAYFDFDNAEEACSFMRTAVEHCIGDEDGKKIQFIMEFVDPTEKREDDD